MKIQYTSLYLTTGVKNNNRIFAMTNWTINKSRYSSSNSLCEKSSIRPIILAGRQLQQTWWCMNSLFRTISSSSVSPDFWAFCQSLSNFLSLNKPRLKFCSAFATILRWQKATPSVFKALSNSGYGNSLHFELKVELTLRCPNWDLETW